MENLNLAQESHVNENSIKEQPKEIKPLGIDNFMELLKKLLDSLCML